MILCRNLSIYSYSRAELTSICKLSQLYIYVRSLGSFLKRFFFTKIRPTPLVLFKCIPERRIYLNKSAFTCIWVSVHSATNVNTVPANNRIHSLISSYDYTDTYARRRKITKWNSHIKKRSQDLRSYFVASEDNMYTFYSARYSSLFGIPNLYLEKEKCMRSQNFPSHSVIDDMMMLFDDALRGALQQMCISAAIFSFFLMRALLFPRCLSLFSFFFCLVCIFSTQPRPSEGIIN